MVKTPWGTEILRGTESNAEGPKRCEGLGHPTLKQFLKSRGSEMAFPAFSKSYLKFTRITSYFLPCLSKAMQIEETNTCKFNYKVTKPTVPQSSASPVKDSSQVLARYQTVRVASDANGDLICMSFYENVPLAFLSKHFHCGLNAKTSRFYNMFKFQARHHPK